MKNYKIKRCAALFLTLCIGLTMFSVCAQEDEEFYKTVYKRNYIQMWEDGIRNYIAEEDGWITYCNGISSAGGNSVFIQDSSRGGQLAGGQDNAAAAVYNTTLGGANIIKGQNYGLNMRLQIWFNAVFDGTKPKSGFYFRHSFTSDTIMYTTELVYQDENGKKYTLYTSPEQKGKGKTYQLDYEISFDAETARLKLKNDTISDGESDTGVINLKQALADKGIEKYNQSGMFGFVGEVQYGFVAIRDIEIKSQTISADRLSIKCGSVEAETSNKSFPILNKNEETEFTLDLSGQVGGISAAELYIDGEKACDFAINGTLISAVLPVPDERIHSAGIKLRTAADKNFTAELGKFSVRDGTVIANGFTSSDGETVTNLSEAFGKELSANFKYSCDGEAVVIICLYDERHSMCGISYGAGSGGTASATISVPSAAEGYTVKAFMCRDFVNSAPISGVSELR